MRSWLVLLSAGFTFATSACSTDSNSSNGAGDATGGGGEPGGGGASGGGRGPSAGSPGSAGTAGEPQAGRGSGGQPATAANCSGSGFDPEDFDSVYEVGPGLDYETPSDVPWESVGAGSLVRVHYRAEPYR